MTIRDFKLKNLIFLTLDEALKKFSENENEILSFLSCNDLTVCDDCTQISSCNEVRYHGYDFVFNDDILDEEKSEACICDSCISDYPKISFI